MALYLTDEGQKVNLKCLSVLDFVKTNLIQFELTLCHYLYVSTSKTEDVKGLTWQQEQEKRKNNFPIFKRH